MRTASVLRAAAAVFALACGLLGREARAEPPRGTGKHRIEWKYPRFRAAEVTWTAGAMLTTLFVEWRAQGYSPDNGWHNGILFDDAVRDALRSRTKEGRVKAAEMSNHLWHPTQYYPVIVDGLIAPLLFDNFNTDAALQMTLLNWEVQSTTLFFLRLFHRSIGRWRPGVHGCSGDASYDERCSPENYGRNGSFPAGHTAMAFSGAALTCIHHQYLRIYGSSLAGNIACAATLASATAVGILRIVSENHWATDSLVGVGLGVGIGIGMPYLLHYGPHLRSKHGAVSLLPWTDAYGSAGISITGTN